MKRLLFLVLLLFPGIAPAKVLKLTVAGIRNERGNILVMIRTADSEEPRCALIPAAKGEVEMELDNLEAGSVDIQLFHDEDGDMQLKMGDRGPLEGYATGRCKLAGESTEKRVRLYYPETE